MDEKERLLEAALLRKPENQRATFRELVMDGYAEVAVGCDGTLDSMGPMRNDLPIIVSTKTGVDALCDIMVKRLRNRG